MMKTIAYAFVLIVKTPGLLINFFRFRRVGVRTFRQELQHFGIEPGHAEELSKIYASMVVPEWKQLRGIGSQGEQGVTDHR
jgi:hypothetical protein